MKNIILLALFLAIVGCSSDDDAPPPSAATSPTTIDVRIDRWWPTATEPVTKTVAAPTDSDSVVLVEDLGDYWCPVWTLVDVAIYGQTDFWAIYRPIQAGASIAIRYEHLPSAAQ